MWLRNHELGSLEQELENSACSLFGYHSQVRNGFKLLNVEIKSKGDFSDPSTYEIQMSVTINSVLLGQNHTHLFPYCLGLPLCYNGRVE